MERYTKQDKDGRYYIESVNGKLESNVYGHVYGESIDRFAELESADVVKVVRCENCKFYCFNRGVTYCTHKAGLVSTWQSNFCGYGERKGKNDE